jgi:hypothetical protein
MSAVRIDAYRRKLADTLKHNPHIVSPWLSLPSKKNCGNVIPTPGIGSIPSIPLSFYFWNNALS